MVTFRESFEVFCFSVMESSFCFVAVLAITPHYVYISTAADHFSQPRFQTSIVL